MYVKAACDIRPQEKKTHGIRLTAGTNLIGYAGQFSSPTSKLTTIKSMLTAPSKTSSQDTCA